MTVSRKYRWMTRLERVNNLASRWASPHGLAPRAYVLLETTGRRSGRPRYMPVGNGLRDDTFWLIAVHGAQSDYVRNLMSEPRVRVKIARRWRQGIAVLLPEDDAAARSWTMPCRWDATIGRMMASAALTIRIDLTG